MTTIRALPALDGTREASNARIAAWLDEAKGDPLDDALHGARMALDEAAGVARSLGSTEECANEACRRAGDVEYLSENLREAQVSVLAAQDAAHQLGDAS